MANGTIDNLNFKVLLDDSEFKTKVNSATRLIPLSG